MSYIIRDTLNYFVTIDIPNDREIFNKMMSFVDNSYVTLFVYSLVIYLLFKHHKKKILLIIAFVVMIFIISNKTMIMLIKPTIDAIRPYFNKLIDHQSDISEHLSNVSIDNIRSFFTNSHLTSSFGMTSFVSALLHRKCEKVKLLFIWPLTMGIVQCVNNASVSPGVFLEGITGSSIGILSFKAFQFINRYI